jgi:hypothetical protein
MTNGNAEILGLVFRCTGLVPPKHAKLRVGEMHEVEDPLPLTFGVERQAGKFML